MAENDSGLSFVSGFLLGGLVGGVVGMLLAPKPGEETRADLVGQSELLRSRAEEIAAQINANIAPTMESVRDQVNTAMDALLERIEPSEDRITDVRGGDVSEKASDTV